MNIFSSETFGEFEPEREGRIIFQTFNDEEEN